MLLCKPCFSELLFNLAETVVSKCVICLHTGESPIDIVHSNQNLSALDGDSTINIVHSLVHSLTIHSSILSFIDSINIYENALYWTSWEYKSESDMVFAVKQFAV